MMDPMEAALEAALMGSMGVTVTLRDYFAAQAMPVAEGMLAFGTTEQVAALAYEFADAMIEARSKDAKPK